MTYTPSLSLSRTPTSTTRSANTPAANTEGAVQQVDRSRGVGTLVPWASVGQNTREVAGGVDVLFHVQSLGVCVCVCARLPYAKRVRVDV